METNSEGLTAILKSSLDRVLSRIALFGNTFNITQMLNTSTKRSLKIQILNDVPSESSDDSNVVENPDAGVVATPDAGAVASAIAAAEAKSNIHDLGTVESTIAAAEASSNIHDSGAVASAIAASEANSKLYSNSNPTANKIEQSATSSLIKNVQDIAKEGSAELQKITESVTQKQKVQE